MRENESKNPHCKDLPMETTMSKLITGLMNQQFRSYAFRKLCEEPTTYPLKPFTVPVKFKC